MSDEAAVLRHIERVTREFDIRFADLHRLLDEREKATILRFAALERLLDEREKALKIASEIIDVKLLQMNEFRAETQSDRRVYARQDGIDTRFSHINDALGELKKQSDTREGRWAMVATGLALVALALAILRAMQ